MTTCRFNCCQRLWLGEVPPCTMLKISTNVGAVFCQTTCCVQYGLIKLLTIKNKYKK